MNKDNLNAAFKALRRKKMIARQRFLCCSNCGWSQLHHYKVEGRTNEKASIAAVFYHQQDAECLREKKDFYLAFGSLELETISTREVGEIVVAVLKEYGVETEWDGDANTRIKIKFSSLGPVPVSIRFLARKAGLRFDTPPEILADKLDDMGFVDDATNIRGRCKR